MRFFGVLLLIGLILAVPYGFRAVTTYVEDRSRKRTGATDPRARSIRDNHAQMARLLDNLLADEMIYPVIPPDRRTKGRELLADYYEEGATK